MALKADRSRYLENFGSLTFDIKDLPSIVGQKINNFFINNTPISTDIAELIALEMKRWAISKGCTHYTHWFQPLTELTAEKHNTFLQPDCFYKRIIREEFSASELIQGEPDASSFPHGGIRSTFEARGYTVWDPSSPSFIMESKGTKTLFIPSIFISYTGEVLDKKTPLLRSMKTLSEACTKLLGLFNIDTGQVTPLLGPEQEYFLIPKEFIKNRLDLNILGYSLFGAKCPKGQKFQDHYFGSIKDNILNFMNETEQVMINLGIPVKTRHNEVAPNQFELAVLPEYCNIASDHNQLIMEIIKRYAPKYGLCALFHEKPFFGVNGSGKHINWSLVTENDTNLFDIPSNRQGMIMSLLFISALVRAVNTYSDLLRAVFACSGNDRRLGGHEAPPHTISVYLGEELTEILDDMDTYINKTDNLNLRENTSIDGLKFLPRINKDNTDRNRTSPIAFTGNKFEFRMTGASQSIAFPCTVINLIMTDSISYIYDKLKTNTSGDKDIYTKAASIIREIFIENRSIVNNGNSYLDQCSKYSSPEALSAMITEKNTDLFTRSGVLKESEINARYRIKQNIYIDTRETEIRIARDMIRTDIIPAIFKYQKLLSSSILKTCEILPNDDFLQIQKDYLKKISIKLSDLIKLLKDLDFINEELKEMDIEQKLPYLAGHVTDTINNARELIGKLEERTDANLWQLSRYSDMFFGVPFNA